MNYMFLPECQSIVLVHTLSDKIKQKNITVFFKVTQNREKSDLLRMRGIFEQIRMNERVFV